MTTLTLSVLCLRPFMPVSVSVVVTHGFFKTAYALFKTFEGMVKFFLHLVLASGNFFDGLRPFPAVLVHMLMGFLEVLMDPANLVLDVLFDFLLGHGEALQMPGLFMECPVEFGEGG